MFMVLENKYDSWHEDKCPIWDIEHKIFLHLVKKILCKEYSISTLPLT